MTTPAATGVDEILALYERWGTEHYDEDLAQLDHALQTAAHARADGATPPVVAAALLHDVGHLLDLRGDPAGPHERTGPAWLGSLFPASVTEPIRLHVAAKRYLCATHPGYAATLSAGSTASLVRQGGPMSRDEAAAFELAPGWADAVALRRWDDLGKADDVVVDGLATYDALLREVACGS